MDRFIARENIGHLRDRLWSEVDQNLRARLRDLLIAEEDKVAADLELLADIDRHISDCDRRIDTQRALLNAMESHGQNGLVHARVLLGCLMESQRLHHEYRRRVLIGMNMPETLTIQITERNQFDGIDPPLRPGDVANVVRCERDGELHPGRIYWVYHVHEDALVGMLFGYAVVRQGRIMFLLHGGTIISPDGAVVAGILSGSDH